MEKIKTIIFDIDGSIMPQGGVLSQKVAVLFRKLYKTGLILGPSTGKNVDYCRGLLSGIGVPWAFISSESGAQYWKLMSEEPVAYGQVNLRKNGSDLSIFKDLIFYDLFKGVFEKKGKHEKFRPELKMGMISLFPPETNLSVTLPWVNYFEEKIRLNSLFLKVQRHGDGCVDILPADVSKLSSIKNTSEIFNIQPKNILTVVDGANDLELTQGGVISIAPSNATAEIKKAVKNNGGYISKLPNGRGFLDGLQYFAKNGFFEEEIAEIILSN